MLLVIDGAPRAHIMYIMGGGLIPGMIRHLNIALIKEGVVMSVRSLFTAAAAAAMMAGGGGAGPGPSRTTGSHPGYGKGHKKSAAKKKVKRRMARVSRRINRRLDTTRPTSKKR
jgi:hypothetical protein